MEIGDKLLRLLKHWQEHNTEHAGAYLRWAEEAEKAGFNGVAQILREVSSRTEDLNKLLKDAEKEVSGG